MSGPERLAELLRAEGGLIGEAVAPDGPTQGAYGDTAASGPRAAGREHDYSLLVEAIYEGYLQHYGDTRTVSRETVVPGDADAHTVPRETVRRPSGEAQTVSRETVVKTDDPDLALLAGDRLFALGLARLAEIGDLEAVAELADLISLSAQAHAEDDPARARAAWAAATAAVGRGGTPELEAAKAAARAGDPAGTEALLDAVPYL